MRKTLLIIFALLGASFGQVSSSGVSLSGRILGAAVNQFPALPSGTGWHSLGVNTQFRTANCYPNGWTGVGNTAVSSGASNYCAFANQCSGIMDAQSSGFFDSRRYVYYINGGGHDDYWGTDTHKIDLTAGSIGWATAMDSAFPVHCSAAMNTNNNNIFSLNGLNVSANPLGVSPQQAGQPWTECVVGFAGFNSVTGLGCTPNSGHTTQGLQFVKGLVWNGSAWVDDSTKDFVWRGVTSVTRQAGSGQDTWILPVGTGITNSSAWIAAYAIGSGSLKGNYYGWLSGTTDCTPTRKAPCQFGETSAVDPDTGVIYLTDPDSNDFSLWLFDWLGSRASGAAPTTAGGSVSVNSYFKITATNGFKNSTNAAAVLWKNPADSKKYYVYFGGCKQEPISSGSFDGTNLSVTFTPVKADWTATGSPNPNFYIFGTGTAADGLKFTRTAVSGTTTVTFNAGTVGGSPVSITTGTITECDQTGSTYGVGTNGIHVAEVTNVVNSTTGAVGTVTMQDWTDATISSATCREFMVGGTNPNNNSATGYGGSSPGVTNDGGNNGHLIGWPNDGGSLYDIVPDPVNSKLTCTKLDYTASGSTNYPTRPSGTWGSFGNGKFFYVPNYDGFVVCNSVNGYCSAIKIR